MEAKKWFKSKTVWGGILQSVGGLIVTVGAFLLGEVSTEMLVSGLYLMVKGVYDIVLRFQTEKPITK